MRAVYYIDLVGPPVMIVAASVWLYLEGGLLDVIWIIPFVLIINAVMTVALLRPLVIDSERRLDKSFIASSLGNEQGVIENALRDLAPTFVKSGKSKKASFTSVFDSVYMIPEKGIEVRLMRFTNVKTFQVSVKYQEDKDEMVARHLCTGIDGHLQAAGYKPMGRGYVLGQAIR